MASSTYTTKWVVDGTMPRAFISGDGPLAAPRRANEALFRSVNLDPCGSLSREEWARIFDDADVNRKLGS